MTDSQAWSSIDDRFPRLHWRLDETAYAAFGRYGTLVDFEEGEAVFPAGVPSISFYLVLDGEVRISSRGKEIAVVGDNHSFGELAFLLDMPRYGSAVATKPTKLLEITRADIGLMQEKEPVWSTRLYRVMAESLAGYLRTAAENCAGSA